MGNRARDHAANPFLTIGVAASLAIGSIGYISGSAPEWVVVKASFGLISFGIIGWLASVIVRKRGSHDTVATDRENIDVALPESTSTDPAAVEAATTKSKLR